MKIHVSKDLNWKVVGKILKEGNKGLKNVYVSCSSLYIVMKSGHRRGYIFEVGCKNAS